MNLYLRNLVNNLKVLGVVAASVVIMDACKPHQVVVKAVYVDGKQIVVESDNGEEYMLQYSKNGKQDAQLKKDAPNIIAGDHMEFVAKKINSNWEGHRIVTTDDYRVKYDENLPRIREEKAKIDEIKAAHVADTAVIKK